MFDYLVVTNMPNISTHVIQKHSFISVYILTVYNKHVILNRMICFTNAYYVWYLHLKHTSAKCVNCQNLMPMNSVFYYLNLQLELQWQLLLVTAFLWCVVVIAIGHLGDKQPNAVYCLPHHGTEMMQQYVDGECHL